MTEGEQKTNYWQLGGAYQSGAYQEDACQIPEGSPMNLSKIYLANYPDLGDDYKLTGEHLRLLGFPPDVAGACLDADGMMTVGELRNLVGEGTAREIQNPWESDLQTEEYIAVQPTTQAYYPGNGTREPVEPSGIFGATLAATVGVAALYVGARYTRALIREWANIPIVLEGSEEELALKEKLEEHGGLSAFSFLRWFGDRVIGTHRESAKYARGPVGVWVGGRFVIIDDKAGQEELAAAKVPGVDLNNPIRVFVHKLMAERNGENPYWGLSVRGDNKPYPTIIALGAKAIVKNSPNYIEEAADGKPSRLNKLWGIFGKGDVQILEIDGEPMERINERIYETLEDAADEVFWDNYWTQ